MITERIDAITKIPPDYRSTLPPCPKSVKVELTAVCDFKCFFCATSQGLRKAGNMKFELLETILRDMREAGVEEIGLFYLGESMLYKRLADAVALAKDIGFPYIFLTTNGRMATHLRVEAVIKAGLDSLKFSFNWADREQCEEVTGVDAFEQVVKNIITAKAIRDEVEAETGHRCGLYASSIKYDGAQQRKMERAVANIRAYVDEHYWLPLYNQGGFTPGAGGKETLAGNVGRLEAMRDPLPCWAVFTEGHVTYDGKLAACCFDHDGRFDMGDLTTTPFMQAWHSQRFQDLRAANLSQDVTGTACEGCIAYA